MLFSSRDKQIYQFCIIIDGGRMKRPLAIGIIFLFTGLALTPSINVAIDIPSNDIISLHNGNHPPIIIKGNDDFTSENGVSGGNGTKDNPYIIKDITIWLPDDVGIGIYNTDAYFVTINCTVEGSHTWAVEFSNVTNGAIRECFFGYTYKNYKGVWLEKCSNIRLENCKIENEFIGISSWGSNNRICVVNCKVNGHHEYDPHGDIGWGIDLIGSNISVIGCRFKGNYEWDIKLRDGNNNTVKDCILEEGDCQNEGIMLENIEHTEVINCNSSVKGISIIDSSNISIFKNTVKFLNISYSKDVNIYDNVVESMRHSSSNSIFVNDSYISYFLLGSNHDLVIQNNTIGRIYPLRLTSMMKVERNNILSRIWTFAVFCKDVYWNQNYWEYLWRPGPALILGFPKMFLDENPASEPYDIEV